MVISRFKYLEFFSCHIIYLWLWWWAGGHRRWRHAGAGSVSRWREPQWRGCSAQPAAAAAGSSGSCTQHTRVPCSYQRTELQIQACSCHYYKLVIFWHRSSYSIILNRAGSGSVPLTNDPDPDPQQWFQNYGTIFCYFQKNHSHTVSFLLLVFQNF